MNKTDFLFDSRPGAFTFAALILTRRLVANHRAPLKNLMKTFSAKAQEVNRQWWVIDAKDQVLGQVAVAAANLIRGKTRPTFTPHVDTGDFVVVINADKVRLTGKKEQQKVYTSKRGGFIGNQKVETAEKVRQRRPELLVHRAVKGMVPHNRLGNAIITKLKVYAGEEHPHTAQNPKSFAVI